MRHRGGLAFTTWPGPRNKGAFCAVPLCAGRGKARFGMSLTHTLVVLTAAAIVLPAILVVVRAWKNGAWSSTQGPAFEPWNIWSEHDSWRSLINAAVLAANAHNTQPWRFMVADDTVSIAADAERHIGSFDPFRREMHQSLGCAIENLMIAARAHGLAPELTLFQGKLSLEKLPGGPAASVSFQPGEQQDIKLNGAIPLRHTNRGAYDPGHGVPEAVLEEMRSAVPPEARSRLYLFAGKDMAPLAQLIIAATQAIVGDAEMSEDNARWFRFHQREVEDQREGLTLDTNVPSPVARFFARAFPPSTALADHIWLRDTERVHLATVPLLGIIAVADPYQRRDALSAGRIWQRLHLIPTAHGLDAQPLNQPCEMVDRERQLEKPPRTAEALARIVGDPAAQATFVFRAGYGQRPPAIAPRRPIGDVLYTAAAELQAS